MVRRFPARVRPLGAVAARLSWSGFLLLVGMLLAPAAYADPAPGWGAAFPFISTDLTAGKPLVVQVIVPLCDNAQIACGRGGLGSPGNLATNLYWGARFGAKRMLDRPSSGFELVAEKTSDGRRADGWLARAVYRRWVSGSAWGMAGKRIEQILVLDAIHGAHIDRAVDRFWSAATGGASVCFRDGERQRRERVHVVGYAGHNRLMDGKRLPPAPSGAAARPRPSFVLACLSDRFFSARLRAAGSTPLVMTRAYMAPEGYAIAAAARGLGDNVSRRALRDGVVHAYAKWQRIDFRRASRLFAPAAVAGAAATP